MRTRKQIKSLSLQILGMPAEVEWQLWQEVDILVGAFGAASVVGAFERWAEEHRGQVLLKPITSFVNVAHRLIVGVVKD